MWSSGGGKTGEFGSINTVVKCKNAKLNCKTKAAHWYGHLNASTHFLPVAHVQDHAAVSLNHLTYTMSSCHVSTANSTAHLAHVLQHDRQVRGIYYMGISMYLSSDGIVSSTPPT